VEKPALSNLLSIYSLLSGISVKEIENQYQDKGYGDFKKGLAQEVIKFLTSFQEKFSKIDDKTISDILRHGANKAKEIADKKLNGVKEKMGLI
jgi:tryptophanyl-tRNA synthetase